MKRAASHKRLVNLLRSAYSGERGAAFAYRGHWQAAKKNEEREQIHKIEQDEWHHRTLVGAMLKELKVKPLAYREIRSTVIGRSLGTLCRLFGWFFPMYLAGKLESRNIKEYEDAAKYAVESGHSELVDCLIDMAKIEWDHESFFRSKVKGHPLTILFPLWKPSPPKETIGKHVLEKTYKIIC